MASITLAAQGICHSCVHLHRSKPCRSYLSAPGRYVLKFQSSVSLTSAVRQNVVGNTAQQRLAARRRALKSTRVSITAKATTDPGFTSRRTEESRPSNTYLALSILAVVICAVANRVLYKMALVPLGNYVFFLAQLQTFGYVAVYFGILYWRYRAGIVTQPMLDTPKKQFLLIGALEAASSILGFVGAAKLPGVTLPLLSQTIMFWQIGLGYLLLGKKLAPVQFAGAAVVTAGVCTAAWPSAAGSSLLSQACVSIPLLCDDTFDHTFA